MAKMGVHNVCRDADLSKSKFGRSSISPFLTLKSIGIFPLNLKNPSNVKKFSLKIPNIGQNMSERSFYVILFVLSRRFDDSYGRVGDSV